MTMPVVRPVPTPARDFLFQGKALAFRLRRAIVEIATAKRVRRHGKGEALRDAAIVARHDSPLWNGVTGVKDRALTAGKIHNLRLALRFMDGIEVPAGETFSFWKQVGRASRLRGFVRGRELREGCMVANTGGGLCQLSNALFDAALLAGFEIVERHAHSRVVPGSRAEAGRDATVFWNYVDLRFQAAAAFRIEARLTRGQLSVMIRTRSTGGGVTAQADEGRDEAPGDCTRCGQVTCHRHDPEVAVETGQPTAWLVDQCWPEFAALVREKATKADALYLPQRLRTSARHDWPKGIAGAEARATIAALRRAYGLRRAPRQGRVLQGLFLNFDEIIARSYARRLSHLHTHAVISLSLLPHLWRLGVLAGRTFDVLMERAPIAELQAALDDAARHHPDSPTLGDFRAPAEIAKAEAEALAEARFLYTPHRAMAGIDPARTRLIDWQMPKAETVSKHGGRALLFPASALGRKGAYQLREALQGLDVDLFVTGGALERPGDFWPGIRAHKVEGSPWTRSYTAVVLPALVEHQPRALLQALARGIPVIATEACGIAGMAGVTIVTPYEVGELRHAIANALRAD